MDLEARYQVRNVRDFNGQIPSSRAGKMPNLLVSYLSTKANRYRVYSLDESSELRVTSKNIETIARESDET